MMEALTNFLTLFYSAPIAFYSVPFTIFLILMSLSMFGLQLDFNMDGEVDFDSAFMKGFFTHFKVARIPFSLFLLLFFMFSSLLTVIFADLVTDNIIAVSVFMVAIIYPMLWAAILPLGYFDFIFDNTKEIHKVDYIGATARVDSTKVTENSGFAIVFKNGTELEINIYSDKAENGLTKGDNVLVVYHDAENDRYLVEKE